MNGELPALLKSESLQAYIDNFLEKMSGEDVCAMFLIRYDDTERLRKELTEPEREKVLRYTEHVLSTFFRATDIVGQTERNSFLIFLAGAITEQTVCDKARLLCEALQFAVEGRPSAFITVCAGVYLVSGEHMTYQNMYERTEQALLEAQKSGRGSYYVHSDLPDDKLIRAANRPVNTIQLHTLLNYMDGGVCMLEIGPQIRVLYASPGFFALTGRQENELAMPCSLTDTGIHPDYEADYERALRMGASSGKPVRYVCQMRRGDSWFWCQSRAVLLDFAESRYPVMLEMSSDITEMLETSRKLRESNERLRVAFELTPHVMWEVDVRNRTFYTYDVSNQSCDTQAVIGDFPEGMIQKGLVHADSAANFRLFANDLLEGNTAGSANFIMKDWKNKCYEWIAMSYHMTYDLDGQPAKAIGVGEKLPGVSGFGSGLLPRRPLPEILRHHLLARFRVDLTADFVEDLWIHGQDRTAWTQGKSYSEVLEIGDPRLVIRGEGSGFSDRFRKENLLAAYERGERWSSRDHRVIDAGGNIRWMTDTINLQKDLRTGDIHLYACFMDSQEHHDWETLLYEGAEREGTGLPYTWKTLERLSQRLAKKSLALTSATAVIRVVGETDYPEDAGKAAGKRILDFFSVALTLGLGTDCLVGWHRKSSLVVLFPKGETKFELKRRIEDAFAYVRVAMADFPAIDSMRFVAGITGCRTEEAELKVQTLQAEYLCEMWENAAMDIVVFPNDNEDWAWTNLQREAQKVQVENPEHIRPLTVDEQSMVMNCISAMLLSSTLEESWNNSLHCIGEYYRADRVYILSLEEDGQEIRMCYEWTREGKHSIAQVVSGMRLARIPLLARCMREQKPVCVESHGNAIDRTVNGSSWHFIAYPLNHDVGSKGFLCVENAREYTEEIAVLHTLVPYLQKEQGRFRIQTGGHTGNRTGKDEALNRLPNLRTYMNVVYSLNSDMYSSMGALTLDIPNFSGINSSYGFEYGRDLLCYIAETLVGIYGKSFIFRTWDAEFVVLFPNTIQEVFIGRCTRLRTMIQRRYPHQVRIGYTWTDGIFSARELVHEARSLMSCENVRDLSGDREGFLDEVLIRENRDGRKYLIYFQPKIDMRDGTLVGAEALARAIDEEGNVILPARFIENLEKSGEIRDLDFFMLESAMKQLSEWKQQGLPDISISVNISRRTLFNPTTLASILAIQSHYPEISPERVELEITETAGDVEKATLADVVENFGEYGIRFELDDFGSHYANMAMFTNIHFNTVKLDRSLVNDLPDNEISRMLVENIAKICKSFNMLCVAEGVETQQQAAVLLKAGCIYGQGYYYDRPMPAQRFEEKYLKKKKAGGTSI